MTPDEYVQRRNAHEVERTRILGILDDFALKKHLGNRTPDDSPLISKALQDLESISSKALDLERQYLDELPQHIAP